MSAIAQLEDVSDEMIYALARRVIICSMREFDRVWESANKICDRYQVKGIAAS
ncbi:MAG: hypothetical protein JWQ87_3602 [Candidatus Sulfotelmatobacter sp.]|nr:hypothetical protein [Candidatus Sulfotelmatobacter sp.]